MISLTCAACSRKLTKAAGFVGLLPLGPVCLAKLARIKPAKKRRKVQAERVTESQIELNFTEEQPCA